MLTGCFDVLQLMRVQCNQSVETTDAHEKTEQQILHSAPFHPLIEQLACNDKHLTERLDRFQQSNFRRCFDSFLQGRLRFVVNCFRSRHHTFRHTEKNELKKKLSLIQQEADALEVAATLALSRQAQHQTYHGLVACKRVLIAWHRRQQIRALHQWVASQRMWRIVTKYDEQHTALAHNIAARFFSKILYQYI